jgi:hypothetical protein
MTKTEFEQRLDAWLNERLTSERERFLADQSIRSYFRLWLYLNLEAKKRQVVASYSIKEGPSLRERITQFGYALRGLVQKPGRVASRLRYARMSGAERIAYEDAYLNKLLTILRHYTTYKVTEHSSKDPFEAGSRIVTKRPANHVNGAMGPLEDRDMDNDFVRTILEGSGITPPEPSKETEMIASSKRVRENLVRAQRDREKAGKHARRSGD